MKTQRILLRILLVLTYSFTFSWADAQESKDIPLVNGKPLSVWVDQLDFTAIDPLGRGNDTGHPAGAKTKEDLEAYLKSVKDLRKDAKQAVRDLGMKAVPYLLQRVQTPGSYRERQNIPLETSTVFIEISPRVKRGQAVHAFFELLDFSDQIIPALLAILKKPGIEPDVGGAISYAVKEMRRLKEKQQRKK